MNFILYKNCTPINIDHVLCITEDMDNPAINFYTCNPKLLKKCWRFDTLKERIYVYEKICTWINKIPDMPKEEPTEIVCPPAWARG